MRPPASIVAPSLALVAIFAVPAGAAEVGAPAKPPSPMASDAEAASDSPAAAPLAPPVAPPVAAVRPRVFEEFGHRRVDPYYWLRDDTRSNPEMLAYLEAENRYLDSAMAATKPLQEALYGEMVARLPPDDDSVPFRKNGWWYQRRFAPGNDYDRIFRRRDAAGAPAASEELVLDLNERARGHDYYRLADWDVTLDGARLAFAEDFVSRRQYEIRVKDLATGEIFPDVVANTTGDVVWAGDGRTFFYVERDPVTLLGFRVRRHRLGTDPAADPVVWEEKDTSFYTSVARTKSDRFVAILSRSTVSSETRLLPAGEPEGEFRVFRPRERDFEYHVEDLGDRFVVRTNWDAPNWRIFSAPSASTADRSTWTELVAHRDDVFLDDVEAFPGFLALAERSAGLKRVRIHPLDPKLGGDDRYVVSDEVDYVAGLGYQSEQATTRVRYTFTSMKTPPSTWELDVATGARTLLKRQEVVGYDPALYETDRIFVTARDGAQVPVSLLHRKVPRAHGAPASTALDGSAPVLVEAYGAYGYSSDPVFDGNVISLVDRGFVVAIAHVRGGQEMGRNWYEDGRMHHKKNTFHDFVDVSEALVARRIAAKGKVFALGGSAGGLLMGAVATMRPDLFRGVVAAVPFVDVVTTMLDESIPLTSNEFDEWGDPRVREDYEYMLSYSPYDQVKAQPYPNLLVTTGLWDSQVQYYEPAKWVAKLRATKTGDEALYLKTNMEAGHGGKSGRFQRLRDVALHYAFFLDLAGISE